MSDGALVKLLPKYLLGITAPNTPIAGDGTANLDLPLFTLEAASSEPTLPAFTLTATGTGGSVTDASQYPLALPSLAISAVGLTEVSGNASLTLPKTCLEQDSRKEEG